MIGERIALLRHRAGLSQEDLAQAMHVSRQSVSKWEQNLSGPDLSRVVALARYFQVTTDYLLLDEEEQPDIHTDRQQETEGNADDGQETLSAAEEAVCSSPNPCRLCRGTARMLPFCADRTERTQFRNRKSPGGCLWTGRNPLPVPCRGSTA